MSPPSSGVEVLQSSTKALSIDSDDVVDVDY